MLMVDGYGEKRVALEEKRKREKRKKKKRKKRDGLVEEKAIGSH